MDTTSLRQGGGLILIRFAMWLNRHGHHFSGSVREWARRYIKRWNNRKKGEVYSLFIGRYQPPHKGHETLMRGVLAEGKKICIALRDTTKSEENPLSIFERRSIWERVFAHEIAKGLVKVILIPDIDEVCYGRKVGYQLREIRLAEAIEGISGTRIRGGRNP